MSPPTDTPTQRLASHLLGEPIEQWVRARRPVRKSWRQLSAELREITNGAIDVHPQTLINWFPEPREDDDPPSSDAAVKAAS